MTNLSSAGPPNSSALVGWSRESMPRKLCQISVKNSISSPRIVCVSTGSRGAKMVNGWNGQRLIGNSSSTTCERDSSNPTGGFFWNSIDARTALHFSHQNCVRSSKRKVRGSFVGKRCLQQIRPRGLASNKRDSDVARVWLGGSFPLQFLSLTSRFNEVTFTATSAPTG